MTFELPDPLSSDDAVADHEPTSDFSEVAPETAADELMDEAPTTPGAAVNLPLVVVSVGTDHHPFDRLVNWMDEWARDNRRVRVLIQRGTASQTVNADSRPLIPHAELCDLFAEATAVVIHGGPSSVMDARAAGRLPIVMPRNPDFGEHVDGHQLRFGEHIDRHRLARVATERVELIAALDEALAEPSDFTIAIESGVPPGVAAFGRVVDDLLGASTPLVESDILTTNDGEVTQ